MKMKNKNKKIKQDQQKFDVVNTCPDLNSPKNPKVTSSKFNKVNNNSKNIKTPIKSDKSSKKLIPKNTKSSSNLLNVKSLHKNDMKLLNDQSDLSDLKSKEELQYIDNLINLKNSKNANNKFYSKSLITPYVPLSYREKEKELQDLSSNSINRFRKYSNIFDKIKKEIYDINKLNIHESNKKKNRHLLLSNTDINSDEDNKNESQNQVVFERVEERDEEYCQSPKMTIKNLKKSLRNKNFAEFNVDSVIINDSESLVENKNLPKQNAYKTVNNTNINNLMDEDDDNLAPTDENKHNISISFSRQNETMYSNRIKNRRERLYQKIYNVNNYYNNNVHYIKSDEGKYNTAFSDNINKKDKGLNLEGEKDGDEYVCRCCIQ